MLRNNLSTIIFRCILYNVVDYTLFIDNTNSVKYNGIIYYDPIMQICRYTSNKTVLPEYNRRTIIGIT